MEYCRITVPKNVTYRGKRGTQMSENGFCMENILSSYFFEHWKLNFKMQGICQHYLKHWTGGKCSSIFCFLTIKAKLTC